MPGPGPNRDPIPAAALALALAWSAALGCSGPADPGPGGATPPPLGAEEQAAYNRLLPEVSGLIDEHVRRYASLRYEYTEGLLSNLDRIERTLSGTIEGEPPRFLAELPEEEERAHFRESIRRWEAKTGKDLRAEVDRLQAALAARDATQVKHPEFQREFSRTFDDFVAVEVEELRERRNRAIHAAAGPLLEREAAHPEAVRRIRQLLEAPPYNLTDGPAPAPADSPG